MKPVHRPTAYDRFDSGKRNSWLDNLQAKIQAGINPPVAGPSRTPSPFEPEDDLEYKDVFAQEAPALEDTVAPTEVDIFGDIAAAVGLGDIAQDDPPEQPLAINPLSQPPHDTNDLNTLYPPLPDIDHLSAEDQLATEYLQALSQHAINPQATMQVPGFPNAYDSIQDTFAPQLDQEALGRVENPGFMPDRTFEETPFEVLDDRYDPELYEREPAELTRDESVERAAEYDDNDFDGEANKKEEYDGEESGDEGSDGYSAEDDEDDQGSYEDDADCSALRHTGGEVYTGDEEEEEDEDELDSDDENDESNATPAKRKFVDNEPIEISDDDDEPTSRPTAKPRYSSDPESDAGEHAAEEEDYDEEEEEEEEEERRDYAPAAFKAGSNPANDDSSAYSEYSEDEPVGQAPQIELAERSRTPTHSPKSQDRLSRTPSARSTRDEQVVIDMTDDSDDESNADHHAAGRSDGGADLERDSDDEDSVDEESDTAGKSLFMPFSPAADDSQGEAEGPSGEVMQGEGIESVESDDDHSSDDNVETGEATIQDRDELESERTPSPLGDIADDQSTSPSAGESEKSVQITTLEDTVAALAATLPDTIETPGIDNTMAMHLEYVDVTPDPAPAGETAPPSPVAPDSHDPQVPHESPPPGLPPAPVADHLEDNASPGRGMVENDDGSESEIEFLESAPRASPRKGRDDQSSPRLSPSFGQAPLSGLDPSSAGPDETLPPSTDTGDGSPPSRPADCNEKNASASDIADAQTAMIDQPDAEIIKHAPHATDALHEPVSFSDPTISIPSVEEEEAQITAASGLASESSPVTSMVDQKDVEIIHHAPHVQDLLHAPADPGNPLISIPLEDESVNLASASDKSVASTYLPDPMAPPPTTQLEIPLQAGDMIDRDRSPSMIVEPPIVPPPINIESRPPSRDESPTLMPDPRAAPPDAHIPSPLQVNDLPLQQHPTPSVVAEAAEQQFLPTPIDGDFAGSPTPELPDPRAPAPDAWLPMPDVPVAAHTDDSSVAVKELGEPLLQSRDADVISISSQTEALEEQAGAESEGVKSSSGSGDPVSEEEGTKVQDTEGDTDASAQSVNEQENVEPDAERAAAPIARDFALDEQQGLTVPVVNQPIDTPASERDVDFALENREATPYAPLRHQHGNAAQTPGRARQSVSPGDSPITRSHCDYRKIRLSSDTQSGTFLIPQCILGDVDRIRAEDVEDLGKASIGEEKAGKKNVVSHQHPDVEADLAAKLHRVAGAIFDEGHLYLLSVEQLYDELGDLERGAEIEDASDGDAEEEVADIQAAPAGNTRSKTASVEPEVANDQPGDGEHGPAAHTRSKTLSVEPETSTAVGAGDFDDSPTDNTRSKTDSVEPGLGMVSSGTDDQVAGPAVNDTLDPGAVPVEAEIDNGTSSRASSESQETQQPAAPRRSNRLSASVEPVAPVTRSGQRSRSAALTGGTAMGRTASATSQGTVPEETLQGTGTRRRSRRQMALAGEEPDEEPSDREATASAPQTPARGKNQSKNPPSSRRVSTKTRSDEAPYRPVTPNDAPESDNEDGSPIRARSKPRSTRKTAARASPVVEIPTRIDTTETPPASNTRKRKHRLSAADKVPDEPVTPSKRRAVSDAEVKEPEARTTRSKAAEKPEAKGWLSRITSSFKRK